MAPSLLRACSSPRFPQQNVHKHILWPGLFICCQGDKANSCWLGDGSSAQREAAPVPARTEVGWKTPAAAHPALCCEGTRGPATVPHQHRAAREGSRWPGDLDVTETIVPLDGLWEKSHAPLNPAWHARVSDRRKI